MVRSVIVLAALAWGLVTPVSAQTVPALAPGGLAIFSPTRAYAMSADGRAAQTRLSAVEAERTAQIETRRRALQTQRDELARSSALLGDGARAQRMQAIQRFEVDLDRFVQDAQAEVLDIQREMESAFLVKLRPALEGVIKERALQLVLNEDAGLVAWADPSLDITEVVVTAIEAAIAK